MKMYLLLYWKNMQSLNYHICISFASNLPNFQFLSDIRRASSISTTHFLLRVNSRLRHSRNDILWIFSSLALHSTILSSNIQTEECRCILRYIYICIRRQSWTKFLFLNKDYFVTFKVVFESCPPLQVRNEKTLK